MKYAWHNILDAGVGNNNERGSDLGAGGPWLASQRDLRVCTSSTMPSLDWHGNN